MLIHFKKDYLYAFLTAAFIYAVTAIFSIGYDHPDEDYQIIEFAAYKLGINQASGLTLDFAHQLRPGLQPFLAYTALGMLSKVGISDPFTQMAIIRMGMGFFCLLISFLGIKALIPSVREESLKHTFIVLAPLLWFMPFLSVRFSAEILSGALFMLAFSLSLLKREAEPGAFYSKIPWLIIGLLLGLAFEAKYATVVMIVAFLAWLIIKGESGIKPILLIAAGFGLAIALGFIFNRWLYGCWCSPFYNSILYAINSESQRFSAQPWYFIFGKIFLSGGVVIGAIILACLALFWIKHFSNPVAWVTLSLFLFYVIVPHKELRFLYSIGFMIPYVIIFSCQDLIVFNSRHFSERFKKVLFYTIVPLFIFSNFAFVVIFAFKPADPDTAAIKFIRDQYDQKDVVLLYADHSNPWDPYETDPVIRRFYLPQELEMHSVKNCDDIPAYYSRKDKLIVLCVRKQVLNQGYRIDKSKFKMLFESMPYEYFLFSRDAWDKESESLLIFQYNSCKLLF
jgi:phosphatidylinositol glycan class B